MTDDDQQAMNEALAELKTYDSDDLMRLSGVIGRVLLAEPDLEGDRAHMLAQLQIVPTMLSFAGVSDAAIGYHLALVWNHIRSVPRPLIERVSTELTMHAATLVRVSTRQSSGLLLLARVLYVLAHEDERG